MSPEWMALWALAFLDTVLIETPIYVALLGPRIGVGRAALVSLGLQMTTHPVLWLAWPSVSEHVDYTLLVVTAEVLVVLAEAALVALVLGPRPSSQRLGRWTYGLVVSLVANATSTLFGFVPRSVRSLARIGIAVVAVAVVVILALFERRDRQGASAPRIQS